MHITYEMVRDDLPAIIATRGEDFVYTTHPAAGGTCMYVYKNKPDCLIGCYLADLGVPLEAFADVESKGIDDILNEGHLDTYVTADHEAIHAMARIQQLQDDSYSWGDSYASTFE